MRVSKYGLNLAGTDQGSGGGGEAGINVRSCYTLVLLMSSKMRQSRHLRKFQTMINSSMSKLLWPSDIAVNQRAPEQLQLDDCIYPSPWGSL